MEGSCLEAEETDLDTGAQPAITSSRSEGEVLPLARGWRLRPGIGVLLGVSQPPLVTLDQVMVGDPTPVGEHQLPH